MTVIPQPDIETDGPTTDPDDTTPAAADSFVSTLSDPSAVSLLREIGSRLHQLTARRPAILLLSVCGLHLIALLTMVTPIDAPTVYPDEFGYVAIARSFSGAYPDPQFVEVVYHFGYGAMLTPLAAVFQGPNGFHAAAQTLNMVLSLSVLLMLWHVARRVFAAEPYEAAAATLLGAVAPALLVQPALVWSESALTATATASFLLLYWTAKSPTLWRGLALAATLGWAYAVHPRAIGLVAASLLVLAFLAVTRALPTRVASVAIVATVIAVYAARAVQKSVGRSVFGAGPLPLEATSEWDLIFSSAIPNADRWLRGLVGAVWYQGLVTLGLVVVVALWAFRIIRSRYRQPDAEWALATALSLTWGAALVIGALVFLGAERRIDHAVYGRYAGHLTPLLLCIGAMLVFGQGRDLARTLRVASALVVIGGVLTRFAHPRGLWEQNFAVPNATAFGAIGEALGGLEPLRVGIAGAILILLMALMIDRRGALGLVVPIVFLFAVGWYATVLKIDPRSEWSERNFAFASTFPAEEGPIVIGEDIEEFITRYGIQYWSPQTEFVSEEFATDDSRIWVTESERSSPTDDARLYNGNAIFSLRYWARPGPFYDILEWNQLLFWPDIDDEPALPSEATWAEFRTTVDEPIEMDVDEWVDVPVWVRHNGRNHPWPNSTAIAGDFPVRLGARWFLDGEEVGQNRTELSSVLTPNATGYAPIRLMAVGHDTEPLAPGQYVVEIDLLQEFMFWFGDRQRSDPIRLTVLVS